ncbi:hypothetical protein [Rhodanobacter sp. OR87]|uniref:hypothetical protein n=1 Tax=Rhodanobacter sp. OR87 TaxID=1076523 RepID=UPI0004299E75|nr:hypothetical protein [Rhodanobacter sp. OR87]
MSDPWTRLLQLAYFMLLAYCTNMAPPFTRYWRGWNRPIHERLLGSHKTVLGFLCRDPLASHHAATYIDKTGVGAGPWDMFKETRMKRMHAVTITSGTAVTRTADGWHVAKLELVSRIQALLHSGDLLIEPELADAATLARELQDFRVTFSTAGNAQFGAREGAHDDLVLSVVTAIFGATRAEPVMELGLMMPGNGYRH